jgi:hypothetical protein
MRDGSRHIRRIEVAMKAIQLMRFRPPDVLELIDVPTPKATTATPSLFASGGPEGRSTVTRRSEC